MSSYTSLLYYSPLAPAKLKTGDLAVFVDAFSRLGVTDAGLIYFHVKFGTSVRQDDRPASWMEESEGAGYIIGRLAHLDWDLDEKKECLSEVASALRNHDQQVYRADLSLGTASAAVIGAVSRDEMPENKSPLCLWDWRLSIGPVQLGTLQVDGIVDDRDLVAGWMALSLSGQGYMYPWTSQDLVRRAQDQSGIRAAMELCRSTWPVPSKRPGFLERRRRRKMRDCWPYAEVNQPLDWFWGVSESG